MTNVSEVALGKSNDIYHRGLEMENPDLDFMANLFRMITCTNPIKIKRSYAKESRTLYYIEFDYDLPMNSFMA